MQRAAQVFLAPRPGGDTAQRMLRIVRGLGPRSYDSGLAVGVHPRNRAMLPRLQMRRLVATTSRSTCFGPRR